MVGSTAHPCTIGSQAVLGVSETPPPSSSKASSSESHDPQWQTLGHIKAKALGGAEGWDLGLSQGKKAFSEYESRKEHWLHQRSIEADSGSRCHQGLGALALVGTPTETSKLSFLVFGWGGAGVKIGLCVSQTGLTLFM